MGNSKSKSIKNDNSIYVTLVFQQNKPTIIPAELIERKVNSDSKFSYYKLPDKTKTLVNKNLSFYISIFDTKTNKEIKSNFIENYRFNDKDYNINYNVIDGYKWIDYDNKEKPFIKVRHNKFIDPCQIIINESY